MTSKYDVVHHVSELIPNLHLTSVYGATKENIMRRNITLLVNAAQELPKVELPGIESIKLFLDDTPWALASAYFDRISDKIHEHLNRGGRVLVHCMLGVSRSATLCIAYLMKYKNMSLKQAHELVVGRRSCARPNPGFWRQLMDYESRIMNTKSLLNSKLSLFNKSKTNVTNTNSPSTSSVPIPITITKSNESSIKSDKEIIAKYVPTESPSDTSNSLSLATISARYHDKPLTREFKLESKNSAKESSFAPLNSYRADLLINTADKNQRPLSFSTTYRSSYNQSSRF